jgi:single-strand DNA-binding protein
MVESKNAVELCGFLAKDPEILKHHRGTLARLSLVTEEYHKNTKGEQVKCAQWHQLSAWGEEADMALRKLKKGMALFVKGRLVHNSFRDREGVRRQISEVSIQDLEILG